MSRKRPAKRKKTARRGDGKPRAFGGKGVREDAQPYSVGGLGDLGSGLDAYQFADYEPRAVLPRFVIDDLYTSNLIVQRMVHGIVEDSLAVEPVLVSDRVDGDAVLARLRDQGAFDRDSAQSRALTYSRKDGGGLFAAFVEDGRPPSEPVDLANVTRIRGYAPLSRWEATVAEWDLTPGTTWYGDRFNRPLSYNLTPTSGAASAVRGRWHRSRVIPFSHVILERRLAERYRGWGPGVIESMFFEIVSRQAGIRRVNDFMRSIGYDHLEVGDLDQKLLAKEGADFFKGYLDDLRAQRDYSGTGVAVIATQKGTKINPLVRNPRSVDKLVEAQRSFLVDGFDGTALELFGSSYTGISGDDMEGERSQWRKVKRAFRRSVIWPGYRQMAILEMAAKLGPTGGEVDFGLEVGGPGWEPEEPQSEEERARTRKLDAEARQIEILSLGLSPAQAIEHDPTVDKTYPTLKDEAPAESPGAGESPSPDPDTPSPGDDDEEQVDEEDPLDLVTEPEVRERYKFGKKTFRNMLEIGLVRNYGTRQRRRYSLSEVRSGLARLREDSRADPPRTFTMTRRGDVHGVSGTGDVMDGVAWPNGRVTTCWMVEGAPTTQTAFDDYEAFLRIHVCGHDGNGTLITFHDGEPAPLCHEELEVDLEARADAEAWARTREDQGREERILEARKKFNEVVNMTPSRLREWAGTECSRAASLSRAPIERVLRLLELPAKEWDLRDATQAMRVVSFVSRMLDNARGEPARKGCPSKRDVSLRNWGRWV